MTSDQTTALARALTGGVMRCRQTDAVLACNAVTAAYALTLTEAQATALVETSERTLCETGRIELGPGILGKLILAFCDSPYIGQAQYEETLHALIELFYAFKNETADCLGDDDLIERMKRAFNGECFGSLALLSEQALPALVRQINGRRGARSFADWGEPDDEP